METDRKGKKKAHQLPRRCGRLRLRHPLQRGEGEDRDHELLRQVRHRHRDRRYVRPSGGERFRRGLQRGAGAPQGAAGPVHPPVHQATERGAEAPGHRVHRRRSVVLPHLSPPSPTGRSRPPTYPSIWPPRPPSTSASPPRTSRTTSCRPTSSPTWTSGR